MIAKVSHKISAVLRRVQVWLLQPFIRLPRILWFAACFVLLLAGLVTWTNLTATRSLHAAQTLDKAGRLSSAQAKLDSIWHTGLLPNVSRQISKEQTKNRQLISNAQKLQRVAQLLKEHKTQAAKDLLKSIANSGVATTGAAKDQIAQLQKTVQTQIATGSSGTTHNGSGSSSGGTGSGGTSSPTNGSGGSGTTGGSGGGTGGSTGGSGSGGAGGSPTPQPMTQLTVNSFSAVATPYNASHCSLSASVNFSSNGTGTATITWEVLSSKTSSAIYNPVSYSFLAAGSQADSLPTSTLQGLESGDSYRVLAVIVDSANSSVAITAGPTYISNCASPAPLLSPSQTSFMSSGPVSTNFTSSQYADNIFPNECNISFQDSFSVSGPGSVQLEYVITSGASIGATLYANQQYSFTGPGNATDISYVRMPHLPGGGLYTIQAILNVLGDPAHTTTAGPITSACS